MKVEDILKDLEKLGRAQTKKIFMRHGAKEPFFGVKVGDMKKIIKDKKLKKQYELALELYKTGNTDAMYLAGLITDEARMSKKDLQGWVKNAYWYMLSDYTVATVTAETEHGFELALEWIESDQEMIASAGWATLGNLVSIKDNKDLDLKQIQKLLKRVVRDIHEEKNRVKYSMNGYVIAVGSYIPKLSDEALSFSEKIGKVKVEMGGTSCKVPFAPEYILKIKDMGRIGRKRKP